MTPRCATCSWFHNDPLEMEQAIVGLNVMSSGHASVRAEDGLCERLERYLSAQYHCDQYQARADKTA
jgi:hypothetical protein